MARKGNQRPTNSVIISTRRSVYVDAIDIYERAGRKAQTWQKNILKPIMAQTAKGLWAHTRFGYSVPRRNGKNEVVAIRELWGLMHGEQILHTAHRTTTSRNGWKRLCLLLDKMGKDYSSIQASGRERIALGDGVIEFRTRSSKGGLGEGFDLLVIDEAQEYTNDQESALKYVVSDSKRPQTIFCGTPPTPLSAGTVFTELRKDALAGGTKNTGWADWSVSNESDPQDRELWYLTNPSLGTILTERSIEDEITGDDIDFNIQRLGLWIQYNQKSAITATDWAALKADKLPALTGRLSAGIKFGRDGANVALSIAVKTQDGRVLVEAIDCQSVRNGPDWIVRFLSRADVRDVAIDGASGQDLLAKTLKKEGIRARVILPTVAEVIAANALWEQGLYQKTIAHMDQPSMTAVATNCVKRQIGSRGGFGYDSQIEGFDISLMESAIFAHWCCQTGKPENPQIIRY